MIISLIILVFVLETVLSILNLATILRAKKSEFLSEFEQKNIKIIKIQDQEFKLKKMASEFVLKILFLLIYLPIISKINPQGVMQNAACLGVFLIINIIFMMFFSYFEKQHETKLGFNKQSKKRFFSQLAKALLLAVPVIFVLLFAVLYIFEIFAKSSHSLLFSLLCTWAIFVIFSLFAAFIFPLIVPFFNKLSPVDGVLANKIEALLAEVKFKSSGVFSIDASKDDIRLNAYFAGLFSSKKVVLYDTLIKALDSKELLAVLGHELGHFKNGDIKRNLMINCVILFVNFYILALFANFIMSKFGLSDFGFCFVFALLFLGHEVGFFMQTISNYFSRKCEFAADKFGALLTKRKYLKSALVKMAKINKSPLEIHPLYEMVYASHPSLEKRLKAL